MRGPRAGPGRRARCPAGCCRCCRGPLRRRRLWPARTRWPSARRSGCPAPSWRGWPSPARSWPCTGPAAPPPPRRPALALRTRRKECRPASGGRAPRTSWLGLPPPPAGPRAGPLAGRWPSIGRWATPARARWCPPPGPGAGPTRSRWWRRSTPGGK